MKVSTPVRLFLLSMPLALLGCTHTPVGEGTSRTAAEPDVLEAVFRYQFEHNASGIQQGAARYCLSLPGDKMPDPGFLQRFAGNQPPVVSADQCDRQSGKDLFFQANSVEWVSDDEVRVRGGYWEGNLSSSVESFQVVREGGRWVVKEGRLEVIS